MKYLVLVDSKNVYYISNKFCHEMHSSFKNKKTICEFLDKHIIMDVAYIVCQYYESNTILDNELIETLCSIPSIININAIKWINDEWFHMTELLGKHIIYKMINNVPTVAHKKFTDTIIDKDYNIIHIDDNNIVILTQQLLKLYEYCELKESYNCTINTHFYNRGLSGSRQCVIFRKNKNHILVLYDYLIHIICYNPKLKHSSQKINELGFDIIAIKNNSIVFLKNNYIFELDDNLNLSLIHILPQDLSPTILHIILDNNTVTILIKLHGRFYKGFFVDNVFTTKKINLAYQNIGFYFCFGNSFLRYHNKNNSSVHVYDLLNEKLVCSLDNIHYNYSCSENMRYIVHTDKCQLAPVYIIH